MSNARIGRRRFLSGTGCAGLLGMAGASAWPAADLASTWKPPGSVTLIVPYPPAGGADTLARLMAPKLAATWGVPVLVLNKAGANGSIGASALAASPPDGRSLMVVAASWAFNHLTMKKVRTDPARDFTPVSMVAQTTVLMIGGPSAGFRNAAEMVRAARAAPGRYTIGSTDTAGLIYSEALKAATGAVLTTVPYKGGADLVAAVLGGVVDAGFASVAVAGPHLKAGTLRALAVAGPSRDPKMPDVLTFDEQGWAMPWFGWQGLFGPAGLSAPVQQAIHAAVAAALTEPGVAADLDRQGIRPVGTPPADFQAFFARVLKENAEIAKRLQLPKA